MAPPPRGVYTPVVAFFNEDETLDLDALAQHVTRIAKAGATGFVLQGSNGEAPHLSHEERVTVISTVRKTISELGRPDMAIIAGCGAQSTRETIQLCKEAAEAGAGWALVLSPSYWTGAMSKPVISTFFKDVATASPLPVLIYNFPAVTQGIDLDSTLISSLSEAHPNIVGCKLTCGNLGKLHRIAYSPSCPPSKFAPFAGKSDFFLHGLVAGSNGVIAAAANFSPKVHVKLLEKFDAGDLKGATELQTKLSEVDWVLVQLGVAGLKAALAKYYGYGAGRSRKPLTSGGEAVQIALEGEAGKILQGLVDLEADL